MKKIMKTATALFLAMVLFVTCAIAVSAETKDSAEISFGEVATLDPGDINADKTANIKDLVRLKKYVANASLEENPIIINSDFTKCDLDESGALDSDDIVLLRKLLLGENIFEKIEEQ